MNNPSGTWTHGNKLTMYLKTNASNIFNVTWGSKYWRENEGLPLTVGRADIILDFVYNTDAGLWTLVSYFPRTFRSTFASSATPTPRGFWYENEMYITALAVNATIGAPEGTPMVGSFSTELGPTLIIRIKDNGTSRTLTWNVIYRAIGVTLPTSTTASKTIYVKAIYNSLDNKWDVILVQTEV